MPSYNTSDKRDDTDGNSSATITGFTAGAGSRRILEVYLLVSAGSIATHSGVTWGGVSLTQRGTAEECGTYGRGTHWYLLEASFPGSATGDVVGTCASSQDQIVLFAIVSNDVNQSTPFENGSQTTGLGTDSNSATVTVTSSATALVTHAVMGVDSGTNDLLISADNGTSRQEVETVADYTTWALGTIPGASPNVAPAWTLTMAPGETMSKWRMFGDALKDDPGGGGGGATVRLRSLLGVGT